MKTARESSAPKEACHPPVEKELREQEASSPERVCPNCGAPLTEFRCKLLCPNRQCGYSMSCSDFY